jgi:hypothetical protein
MLIDGYANKILEKLFTTSFFDSINILLVQLRFSIKLFVYLLLDLDHQQKQVDHS